jgi:hypothetical protein
LPHTASRSNPPRPPDFGAREADVLRGGAGGASTSMRGIPRRYSPGSLAQSQDLRYAPSRHPMDTRNPQMSERTWSKSERYHADRAPGSHAQAPLSYPMDAELAHRPPHHVHGPPTDRSRNLELMSRSKDPSGDQGRFNASPSHYEMEGRRYAGSSRPRHHDARERSSNYPGSSEAQGVQGYPAQPVSSNRSPLLQNGSINSWNPLEPLHAHMKSGPTSLHRDAYARSDPAGSRAYPSGSRPLSSSGPFGSASSSSHSSYTSQAPTTLKGAPRKSSEKMPKQESDLNAENSTEDSSSMKYTASELNAEISARKKRINFSQEAREILLSWLENHVRVSYVSLDCSLTTLCLPT